MAEEQGQKPDFLAGGRDVGSYAPFQLFAGESPIVTDKGLVAADVAQYQVITLNDSGEIVPFVDEATATETGGTATNPAIGVAANPAAAGTHVAYYVEAFFNHLALEWPSELTTLAQRKAVFARTPIHIGELPPVMPTP